MDLSLSDQHPALSVTSEALTAAILRIPMETLAMKEHEIISAAYGSDAVPMVDFGLRHRFSDLYKVSIVDNSKVSATKLCDGICAQTTLSTIMQNPYRMAYIITPIQADRDKNKYLLSIGYEQMLKILTEEIPINRKTGTPDTKYLDIRTKLFMFLYEAQHGKADQKIRNENKNLNIDVSAQHLPQRTMEDLDRELRLAGLEVRQLPPQSEKVISLPVESVVMEAGRVSEEYKR